MALRRRQEQACLAAQSDRACEATKIQKSTFLNDWF